MRTRHLNKVQNQVTVYQTVADFTRANAMPQGYVVVKDHEIPIDMFYKSKGSETTIVCFHGAVEKEVKIPWLIGAGVMKDVEANRLSISDPSLYLYEELQLSWFTGSSQMPTLHQVLEALICKVLAVTESKHVVFFGGSAGGFAALAMSKNFPGSLALPMNPQTSIQKFYDAPSSKYLSTAWPEAATFTDLPANVPHDLVSAYRQGVDNTVAFIQNSRDTFHVEHHKLPLFEAVECKERLWTFHGEWGNSDDDGHVTPPREITNRILQEVGGSKGQWNEALAISGFVPER